jgi:hypothetical protein
VFAVDFFPEKFSGFIFVFWRIELAIKTENRFATKIKHYGGFGKA